MNTSLIRSFGLLVLIGWVSSAAAQQVRIDVTNLAPANGTFLTPVWVGFHNGTFDSYDRGVAASAHLERIAEDGTVGPLSAAFTTAGGMKQATIPGPNGPIAPGETASMMLDLGMSGADVRYFSYASMIIPSNDAFIANGNPLAHQIFSDSGAFLGADFLVMGTAVLDAGTEVNDEIPANTAFFGQSVPNTGVVQNGVIDTHVGFLPANGILADPMFANANFLAQGYQVAHVTVTLVPEPHSIGSVLVFSLLIAARRRAGCR